MRAAALLVLLVQTAALAQSPSALRARRRHHRAVLHARSARATRIDAGEDELTPVTRTVERRAPAAAEESEEKPTPPTPAPTPAVLRAEPPAPKVRAVQARRYDLLGGGLALLVGAYGADVGLTAALGHRPLTNAAIPFAGPILQLRESYGTTSVTYPNSGDPTADGNAVQSQRSMNRSLQIAIDVALVADFAAQLAGATLAVVGAAVKTTRYERVPAKVTVQATASGLRGTF